MSTTIALPPQQQDLLEWLADEARAKRPCPTNEAIGKRFGVQGNSFGTRLLDALEEAGCIFIEKLARGRIVTIIKTGDETARPPGAPPPRAELVQTIGRPALGVGEKRKPYVDMRADLIKQPLARTASRSRVTLPTPTPPPSTTSSPPPPAEPMVSVIPAQPEPEPAMPESVSTPTAAPLPVTMPAGPALNADVTFADGELKLTVYLSTDPGPARGFRPFIIVPLTDIGALELLGTASIALRDFKLASEAA